MMSGDRITNDDQHDDDFVEVYRRPDGGWGWVVTVGTFIVFVITTGSSWAFGILYIAFLDAFEKNKAITAVPGSLIFMTMVITNPYAGLLADKYGHRRVIFTGGLVSSSAIFASSFVNDFTSLTILYGLIGGFGFGLSHLPAVVTLNNYFRNKIGTATGLAMAGTGLGTIFMSVVTQFMVSEYGWRGTMIVLSAINANLCVAAAVMRPLPRYRRPRSNVDMTDHSDDVLIFKTTENNYIEVAQKELTDPPLNITSNPLHQLTACPLPSRTAPGLDVKSGQAYEQELQGSGYYCKLSDESLQKQYQATMNGVAYEKTLETRECKKPSLFTGLSRICTAVWNFFDSVYGFDIWRDLMYLSFLMGINLAFFGFTVVSAHVAKRALEFGFHEYHSSFLVAVLGLSQAAGRSLTGPLIDRCRLNPMLLYQAMSATGGVAIITSIYLPSFPAQACFCVAAGYTTGACATLQTVMCGALFGTERIKFAYGGVMLAVGLAMLISPPVAGLCRDVQGHYEGAFYLAAAACFMSVMAHLPLTCSICPGKRRARTHWKESDGVEGKEV